MSLSSAAKVAGIDEVVDGGFCSGCGACAALSQRSMNVNLFGEYSPGTASSDGMEDCVCPFLVPEENENMLANRFLVGRRSRTDELGYFDAVYAAHVEEGSFRAEGSSGGIGSWLAVELLRKGLIDAVIHVKPARRNRERDPFFKYGVSTTAEEIRSGAHSHYHAVEISQVMQHVRDVAGRYLFVGVPCFAKAVRRLQLHDEMFATRIRFVASLICGHMKSINWSLSLGWSAGLPPAEIKEITFRVKREGIPAKSYYYGVKGGADDAETRVFDSAEAVGGKFNLGAMMLNACNYCDDVVGETADISIGDAWLPKYSFDWRGKNLLVLRNTVLSELIGAAVAEGRVALEPMLPEDAATAQAGGLRQRREGLAYRIGKKRVTGEWHPVKRDYVDASQLKFHRRLIYDLREKCSRESRAAFQLALDKKDFSVYTRRMKVMFKVLRLVEVIFSSPQIIARRIQRITESWK
ncbi:MAG: Coenzyme F420 hydrogenase/dehydrogenase, beta subunit C-terminal domain [Candidatus Accumulibacter sp.]|uniref:Coenzyme F420 hydrogenase/dehydrogenase, beta subunit C-terminal domain n=1 Tax=Accumulibacter sp. TaxID=2053492 RepID=UPI00258E92F5|nr:Coenzyme F420 hydrogenase/dehydrogenase, beta subunit C-terminal domain [Accumulibacter sp.]MBK8116976.1 Coenzyme F420 hydrogenase/dehydrogenase, beta subunit C-terminal domain [Accumulibacter sp.]